MALPASAHGAPGLLRAASPLLLAACFVLVLVSDFALRMPPHGRAAVRRWRLAAIALLCLTLLTYAAEAALYVARALVQRGWWAGQNSVIFVMASILVWGIMALLLVDSAAPRWPPYLASWLLALLLESAICCLSVELARESDGFERALWAVMLVRVIVLFGLSVVGLTVTSFARAKDDGADEESQSLLGDAANGARYGSIAASDPKSADGSGACKVESDDDDDEDIKERQRQRIFQQGGWWGYLRGFLIFLPLIWPAKNRKMQFYAFVMLLCILSQRVLNVLIPRQVGIITNKLMNDYNTHRIPWEEISLWIGFRILSSRAGLDGIQSLMATLLEQYSYGQITVGAFRHLMGLSMDFHTEKSSGELLKAVEQGNSLTSLMESVFFDTAPLFIDLIAAFIYLDHIFDAYLAFTVIVVAVTFLWTTIKLTSWNREGRRLFVSKYLKESKILYDSVSNWQTVAYFSRSDYEQKRLGAAVQEHIDAYVRYSFTYNLIFASQALIILLGLLVASFIATYRIAQGTASVGSFVTLIQYWATLSSPLSRLSNSYDRLSSDLIDAERMLQLFQTKSSIPDKPDAPPLAVTKGRVEFRDVAFAYDPRKPTIEEISFTAQPGQTVALVGETGSGKSTTLKLLLRFYDVTSGSIRIDDQDIRDVTLDSLRECMGVVPQDPSMFNMSIMENIRYARLDATDEDVHDACRAAAVHDKIMTFPDGYKSKVGERGVKLSGGELQRVAIARVLLKDPHLVLLDEATSAVDSSTEIQIQEAFKKLSKGRTTFIVAHRLSTIMDADLILVIEGGRIIERGTQEELLALGGKYVDLWTKQTSRRTAYSDANTAKEDGEDMLMDDDLATDAEHKPGRPEVSTGLLDQLDGSGNSRSQPDDDDGSIDTGKKRLGLCAKLKGKTKRDADADVDSQTDAAKGQQQLVGDSDGNLKLISPKPTYGPDATEDASGVEDKKYLRLRRHHTDGGQSSHPSEDTDATYVSTPDDDEASSKNYERPDDKAS